MDKEFEIAFEMIDELKRANEIHPMFRSGHEGYAVILEEMTELFAEVMKKQPNIENMRNEAIQIGAMAIKYVLSMEEWENANTQTD